MGFREIRLRRDPACPLCGDAPTITELMDYEHFCATGETRPAGVPEMGAHPSATDSAGLSSPRPDPSASTRSQVPELGPAELRTLLDGDTPPALLDVREGWEWAVSNLARQGAHHIPLAELPTRLGELSAPDGVVVYCRSGARSHRAARILLKAGLFPVWNLAGGLEGWARSEDPDLPVA
ncbi:MAG: hypothetical protein EA422_00620 [Gemmatimonadales bacterium]|nr:MAG: hypothetical protein EA422_00620 [Gemmatimonadales bacterium]